MPVNEFEKQVQKIMSELKLRPSAPSWDNIESELRKKRERRRLVIIWFVTLFLFLAGGLWLIVGTDHSKSTAKNDSGNSSISIEPTEKNNSERNKKAREENSSNKKTARTDQSSFDQSSKNKPVIISKQSQITKKKNHGNNKYQIRGNQKPIQQPGIERRNNTESARNPTIINSLPLLAETKNTGEPIETISAQPELKIATEKIDSPVVNNQTTIEKTVDSTNKKKKPGKWQKVINVEIGWSNYTDGFLGGPKSLNYSASPMSNPGSPASGGIHTPNPIDKSLSFALGFGFRKALGKRTNLTVGLQYHYYSTHIATGNNVKKDTTISYAGEPVKISDYYQNGNQNKYTNHFHVLELPVLLDFRLFKNIPVDLGVGISYGRLLNTNALVFDYQKNIYYSHPGNYVKNYINMFSSLQYTWLNKGKIKVQSGPAVLYNFVELQRASYYGTPHMVSFGIGTNIKF
jgi:hypothetical protein